MAEFITLQQAAALIPSGCTLGVGGFCGFGAPDSILKELAKSYRQSGAPGGLTIVTPASAGDGEEDGWGLSALRADGQIAAIITSVIRLPPALARAVEEERIEGYFLPLGVFSHLFRAAAGREPGVLTHVGLQTFCDPRLEGCRMNRRAKCSGREMVRLMPVDGKDYLFYPTIKMDVAILRGTYADEDGNISTEEESVRSETLELANAVHNNGGIVIFQVKEVVKRGTLDPRMVTVHKHSVDYIVRSNPGEHLQNYGQQEYRPELVGQIRVPASSVQPMEMGVRKIIARRAALELKKGALVNLGLGVSDGIATVANEEGVAGQITLTIETGLMGGVPLTGLAMGAGVNPEALYKMPDTFDLYNGGGLDQAFLSGAEIDEEGNVNVSRFSGKVAGPGGFINIAQNTQKVCFSGVFTAGRVDIRCEDGKLCIVQDSDKLKYVKKVEQVTFSGKYALETGKEVLFISERAVLRLTPDGLMLTEIAPGADLERDILGKMAFRPLISPQLKLMDERIFRPQPMGLVL